MRSYLEVSRKTTRAYIPLFDNC